MNHQPIHGVAVALCILTTTTVRGDPDPLRNLDFEGVILPHYYSWPRLFPGWDGAGGVSNEGLNVARSWESVLLLYNGTAMRAKAGRSSSGD